MPELPNSAPLDAELHYSGFAVFEEGRTHEVGCSDPRRHCRDRRANHGRCRSIGTFDCDGDGRIGYRNVRLDQTDRATRHLLLHSSGRRFVSGRDDTTLRDLLDPSRNVRDSYLGLRVVPLPPVTRAIRRCDSIAQHELLVRRC